MMETQAAVLFGTRDLRFETLSIPELKSGQVLVQMAYSGVCHTQLSEFEGHRGMDHFLPHTFGHEGSGKVLKVGPGVKKVKPGDFVILTWMKGEGAEVPSTVYQNGSSEVNSGAISTFMRHTVTCENRVIPIPERMPLREAALLGCMIPTGMGIVFNTARVSPGKSMVVFGAGGIGLSVVLAAHMAKARVIVAVDLHDEKLSLARTVGATHTVNASRCQDILADVRNCLDHDGADYAVEAAGRPQTMELAFQSVRADGGLCVLAGNLAFGERVSIDPFDLIRGKRIIGTWGGETRPDREIPRYVDLYLAGQLKLKPFITDEYPLQEIGHAFDKLKQGRVGRAIIGF